MNFRTTYVLLGLVAAALVALAVFVTFTGDDAPSVSTEGYLLRAFRAAEVKPEKVTSVEIERPGETPDKFVFARDDKSWKLTSPSPARADGPALDALVVGLLNAKLEKSADVSTNLAVHGLDNPPVKVTLRAGPLSATIAIGNVTIGGDRAVVYVTTSDNPDLPQAVRRGDFQALFKSDAPRSATSAGQLVKGITEFRPLKLLGDGLLDPVNQVRSLSVRAAGDELAIFRTAENVWKFRLPADFGEAEVDGLGPQGDVKDGKVAVSSIRQLLNQIADIRPGTHKQFIETPGPLAAYGLDPAKNKPMQIDLSRDDGVKETLFVGEEVKKEGTDRFYARHEADPNLVVEVNASAVRAVQGAMKAKQLLRDRTVLRIAPQRVDAIDVETNGEKFEFRFVGAQWKVYDSEGKERAASKTAVDALLNRLTSKSLATGFPDPVMPDEKKGFGKPAVEVKLWENGIVKEEKAEPTARPKVTAAPTVRLLFGHKDVGDVVYLRRLVGDAKVDFFVPLEVLTLAERRRLDYVEGSLKPFAADSVLKLSFAAGKDVLELERADDAKPAAQAVWKVLAPESLKGRPADSSKVFDLLNQVSFLRPNRVAADRPKEDVLNRLEVNPATPRAKLTVKLKDKTERVYAFGGDVGTEKRTVYLKSADEDMVFEVDRGAFDLLVKADVQDMVVHRIDKTKIKTVKITGWQELLGTPTTLDIERKDGKWALKAGGLFEIEPAKVDLLLNDLTTPRADAFVVQKSGPKPEHNLDVAKNALVIAMDVEGTGVVTTTISPPNKDGKAFATSSALAGDVFTMTDKFAWLRAKPAALKKD